jgi:hypothetical protein
MNCGGIRYMKLEEQEMRLIPLQEENNELPNLLECKWDDEGKLSFEARYTHQHETVANITDQKRSAPCSSVPGIPLFLHFHVLHVGYGVFLEMVTVFCIDLMK